MYINKKSLIFKIFFQATLLLLVFSLACPVIVHASSNKKKQEYVVKLKNFVNPQILKQTGLEYEKLFAFSNSLEFSNIYKFTSVLDKKNIEKKLNGKYEYLEKTISLTTQGIFTSDPGFTSVSTDIDKQWAIPKVGFDSVWVKTLGSKKNIVALIDTGVDATHEDLKTIDYVPGFDFINQKALVGNINSDDNGHGTIMAGILGATANNNVGIVGVNWEISLMPLKALDQNGRGDSSKIAEAIVWATDHGAKIINLSIGGIGLGHDTVLASAIAYAFNKDVVIVAAAGNDGATVGKDLDTEPVFPICDDNNQNMVIGVTAVDFNDQKPDFANFGRNCIDVVAPGKRILSTINFDPLTKKSAPNSYAYGSGTSLAVPFVVGQVALIKALYPNATNKQIRDRVLSSADPVDDLNLTNCGGVSCKGKLGSGRINVKKSLENDIAVSVAMEGDLIQVEHSGTFYLISGGQKRIVSPFVYSQRFLGSNFKVVTQNQLDNFPQGSYATPKDGTLVKIENNPTVYMIDKGQKRPITGQVFKQKQFNYSDIATVSYVELNSWVLGNFLTPKDGTIVRGFKNKNIYWVIDGVLHQINTKFIKEKGIGNFPQLKVSDNDIKSFPIGDSYLR